MKEFDLKKYLAENKLVKEDANDGSQHHIDQIDDDLMYGEFGTVEEVNGYLDNIIAGIERIRIAKVKEIEEWEREEGIEPDFMKDYNPDKDGFDPDREYDDEFSTKNNK